MATYTFENAVINGVDTSKTYNDSTLPLRGVKRIICNGEDKLHKDINKTIRNNTATLWSTNWIEKYKTGVLDKVNLNEDGVKSISYIKDGETLKGFTIEFEIPATFSYEVSENDTVAGGMVTYESDIVKNVLIVMLEFIGAHGWLDTLQIRATNTEDVVVYNKTIEPYMYDLGMSNIDFVVKGRVY